MTTEQTNFSAALQSCLLKVVRRLKAGGTVAMSPDNLWQVSVRDIAKIPGAPVGTNCAYVCRQEFDTVVRNTPSLTKFTNIHSNQL